MNYNDNFKNEIERNVSSSTYIGTGNPNSKILVIGRETATDVENKANKDEHYVRFQKEALEDFNTNVIKWSSNIKNNVEYDSIPNWIGGVDSPLTSNPLFPFKSLHPSELKEGQTWRKYQKLHDFLFLGNIDKVKKKEFDFHNNFFLTEMNHSPAKFTKDADKSSISSRKSLFQSSVYFQSFPVVILACGDYIIGPEIEDIFNVKFESQLGEKGQHYWTHWNKDRTKLVIHTRQLSTNVSNKLLENIAETIIESDILSIN